MTPEQKIKHLILIRAAEWEGEEQGIAAHNLGADQIDQSFRDLQEADLHWDAMNEIREGEVETGLKCEWSRHYESKSVAAQYLDGSWVGWTYWYGGGKHGEPEAIDWMDEAYALDCVEEEKTVTVRTFTLADAQL